MKRFLIVIWLVLLAFLFGVGLAFYLKFPIAPVYPYAKYLGVAILASMDTLFGGLRAWLEDKFKVNIFFTGFIFNSFFAAFLTYLGDQLGIDLYWAAVVAFGVRIFQNLSAIRHIMLEESKE